MDLIADISTDGHGMASDYGGNLQTFLTAVGTQRGPGV
jgi:hypothetical protein